MLLTFCNIIALFGAVFMGYLGYLVQSDMPFIKFEMDNKSTTVTALYSASLIYGGVGVVLSLIICFRKEALVEYKVHNPRRL